MQLTMRLVQMSFKLWSLNFCKWIASPVAFFPEPKVFGLADGWPEEGAPGGCVAEEVIDGRLASCLEKHRTTGTNRQRAEWQTKQSR